jgi:hypothetical protein
MVFVTWPKIEIYDITYLRTVNRRENETVHITIFGRTLNSINTEVAASGIPHITLAK